MEKIDASALVLDDHVLFSDTYSALIERLGLFNRVYAFNDAEEVVGFFIKNSDTTVYLFLDFYLKNGNSLPLLNEVRRLNKKLKIIVMSSINSPNAVRNILDTNPDGFVSKLSGFDVILQCLKTVAAGQQYICPIISQLVDTSNLTEKSAFTKRELDILQYFAKGLSIADTADQVFLSKHTIVAHRRSMMSKANVNSITELLLYAREQELI